MLRFFPVAYVVYGAFIVWWAVSSLRWGSVASQGGFLAVSSFWVLAALVWLLSRRVGALLMLWAASSAWALSLGLVALAAVTFVTNTASSPEREGSPLALLVIYGGVLLLMALPLFALEVWAWRYYRMTRDLSEKAS